MVHCVQQYVTQDSSNNHKKISKESDNVTGDTLQTFKVKAQGYSVK